MDYRITQAIDNFAKAGAPRLLFVTHGWGGGVEQHVRDLVALCGAHARVVVMRGVDATRATLTFPGDASSEIALGDWPTVVEALRALRFDRMHLHHVHGLPAEILALNAALKLPLDCTLHDYWSVCPQYQLLDADSKYCGEPDTAGCGKCLAARPHAWRLDIVDWRQRMAALLARADRVFAPSQSVVDRLARYLPTQKIVVLPHPESAVRWPRVCKVALLGALAPAKGLAVAIALANQAHRERSPLTLRLIGHAAEALPEGFTATGSYDARDLPRLISIERPDVLWLPSQVPETYAYTLSVAIASGLPIVASDIGALGERLRGRASATLLPFDATPSDWQTALIAAAAARDDAPKQEKESTFDDYATTYLATLHGTSPPSNGAPLASLVKWSEAALGPALSSADKPLVDLFRVGVRGGHVPSRAVVENALAELPSGETRIVGRSAYDTLDETLREREDELHAAQNALTAMHDSHEASNQQWREAMAAADERAAAAREHIGHLEGERARLLGSLSWRITRPLRGAARVVRRSAHVARVAVRLSRRAPVILPGAIARFRRGGWRALSERLAQEMRPPAAPLALALPSTAPPEIAQLVVPTNDINPEISIVIPVYGQHATTFACLQSIAQHPPRRAFEIVIMDDASPEPANEALSVVKGVRILRGDENLGFIGNVNAGAAAARAPWLIILNNDTVVRPGALDALVDTFEQHDNVGLVGAKLLNADGTVQEAGGILWRDGSAWNWGRGKDRDDPRFNFVRDADYCSGAALAVRRELFENMGGFDTYYAPAYYEDTDFAFRVRARGLRVLYQPASEIFHLEGVSHGRDENSGIKAYQVANAKKFFERWNDTLKSHRENAVEPELEAHRSSKSNVLIVEACMVTPDQDSGSVRMLNFMRLLKKEGHHVTFVADNLDGNPKYARLLTTLGIEVMHGKYAGSVRKLLRDRGPTLDAIVFCRHYIASQYVEHVRSWAPRARIVFDTVDLHFVREEREAKLHASESMARAAAATRVKELRVISRSDVTIVVSEFEKHLLAQIAPTAGVEIISNIHADSPARASYAAREGILFVGGFRHPPNVDAVRWYATDVLPHVLRLLPGVTTKIVGSNITDEVRALTQPGIEIVGFVENTAPLLQSSKISVAPLRYGAGVKGKVNEAMNHGLPVVATTCAVEGMHLDFGREVLVADDAEGFAAAIARAYHDEALWNALSQAGVNNVHRHFSMEAALPAVKRVFSPAK